MRFSYWPNPGLSWESLLDRARHAEATGWDGLWFADHFMPNSEDAEGPVLECWSVLAALAASVPRVRLGALVTGITYRHPAVLANIATTVDHVSGGRVVLGVGAGWQVNEHEAYGVELGTVTERLDRFDEACQVLGQLIRNDRTTFHGEYFDLDDAPMQPKPVQTPMPLLVGGGGEKRTLRIAARHADEWNVWGTPETLRHKNDVLDAHCEDLERDPTEIARSCQALLFLSTDEEFLSRFRDRDIGRPTIVGTPDEVVDVVGAYRDAGVDELIVPDFTLGDDEQTMTTLDLFIEEVAPTFR